MTSRETYDFAKMLKHIRLAKQYGESLRQEKTIGGGIKETLRVMIGRCRAAERDVLGALSKTSRDIMEEQLLDISVSAQIEGITDMILELPTHSRDTIETYIQGIHKLNKVQAQTSVQ